MKGLYIQLGLCLDIEVYESSQLALAYEDGTFVQLSLMPGIPLLCNKATCFRKSFVPSSALNRHGQNA